MAAILSVTGVASADPDGDTPSQQQVDRAKAAVTDKQRSVAQIQASLAQANRSMENAAMRAEVAAEDYNGAMWRLEEAKAAHIRAVAKVKAARADVRGQRAGIVRLVTSSYQHGTQFNSMNALLSDDGFDGIMNEYGVVQSANQAMQARYDAYTAASARAKQAEKAATKAQQEQTTMAAQAKASRDAAAGAADAAQAAAEGIARQKQQLIGELARAQNISVALAGKRQRALDEAAREKAARAARAAAAAQSAPKPAPKPSATPSAPSSPSNPPSSSPGTQAPAPDPEPTPTPTPDPPAPSGGADAAIAFAKAQLGEPYVWAAAGPSSWDCSGLTMMAWRQGGRSLPHYSAAQYAATTPVSRSQLRPGDLVFWGSSPSRIHHVAMYIGGGKIIHAPRTGRPVSIDDMYYWVAPNYFGRP